MILDYDIWGTWSPTVGPNAPLNDYCAQPSELYGSAAYAALSWALSGFPLNQIILGVPAYGRSFRVKQSDALDASGNIKLYSPFDKTNQPAGDKWDITASGVDVCGNPNVVGGVFTFWGLIEAGFLDASGRPLDDIYYTFDNCAKTVSALRRDILIGTMADSNDHFNFSLMYTIAQQR